MSMELDERHDVSDESDSSSDEAPETSWNPFSKLKHVSVANSSDSYIWVGIQGERITSKGGQEYNLNAEVSGVGVGVGYKRSVKENTLISRIPWKRVQFHKYVYKAKTVYHQRAHLVHYKSM